jgi:hypothetical protein
VRGIAWNFEAFFYTQSVNQGFIRVMMQYRLTKTRINPGCVAKNSKTRRFTNMKSKLVVSLMVVALLLCQGLAFAEVATDEPMVTDVVAVAEDAATGEELVVAEESVNGVVTDAVVADELVAPATDGAAEVTM